MGALRRPVADRRGNLPHTSLTGKVFLLVCVILGGAAGARSHRPVMSSAGAGDEVLTLPAHARGLEALVRQSAEAHAHGGHDHGGCGVGTPHAEAHFGVDDEADVTHVRYHHVEHPEVGAALSGPQHEERRRKLQFYATKNNDGSTFLPLEDADAAGLAQPIRIKVLWDVIEGTDFTGSRLGSNALQCTRIGGPISVPCEFSTSPDCMQIWDGCSVDDIVGPEGVVSDPNGFHKLEVMKTRLDFAVEYFRKAFKVKPVQVPIDLSPGVIDRFNLEDATTRVENADLVVIMTARPSPWAALNGYATCQQRDQHGRCIVGSYNWVPKVLTVADGQPSTSPDIVSAERHTALHELIHVLGGMQPNPTFIDEFGVPVVSGVYVREEDSSAWYRKPVAKIVTPRVVEMAREHFNCPTMRGMPLEDQPTGRAAHWEARIMGPEVMSYGTGTGETYMSDLTFAHLEDTNQYIANYSYTGNLVEMTGDTGGKGAPSKMEIVPQEGWVPPVVYSPGQLRWGRNEGCAFVENSAAEWSDQYRCSVHRDFACSYDNKMSAVCVLTPTWALPEDGTFTCGDCPEGQRDCDARCTLPNDQCDGGCKLPTMFQYFSAEQAAAAFPGASGIEAARTGGFSSAMDYAPVRLSYWNCQQANISSGSPLLEAEAGASPDLGGALGNAGDEMSLFGGQAYCPECRCFVSSLMDLSTGSVNPDFPQFGLCYRHNCFTEEYLQFAIENQLGDGMTWYKCPPEGGKVYIAGFSGAFHCPPAKQFCQFESITGIKYKETNPLWEWIFYATVLGLPTFIVLLCLLIPPFRYWAVHRGKYCCGVNHFTREGHVDADGEIDDDVVAEKPPKVPSMVLLGTNTLVLLCGLFLLGAAVYAVINGRVSDAGPMIIALSSTTVTFSVMGAYGAVKESRGISCVIVSYFYMVFPSCMGFIFFVLIAVLFPASLEAFLEKKWATIVDATPQNAVPETIEEGGGLQYFEDRIAAVVVVITVMFIIFCLNLIMSCWIITPPIVASTMMIIASYSFVFMGFCIVGMGGYVTAFQSDLGADVSTFAAIAVCFGVYLMAANILAVAAAFKKDRTYLLSSMCCELLTFLLFCAGSAGVFAIVPDVGDMMDSLTDVQRAALTRKMGLAGLSRGELVASLQAQARSLGLFFAVITLVVLCQMVSNGYFLYRVRRHVKLMNSRRVKVVPYTTNKKELGPDGEPVPASTMVSDKHRRHHHRHHHHGSSRRHRSGEHGSSRHHRHHGSRRHHGRHEIRGPEPLV